MIRVLIVDDQSLIRTGLRTVLEAEPDIEVIGEAANGAEAIARSTELILQRDEIDRLAAIGEPDHLLENAPMRVAEKILAVDDLGGLVERLVVNQDRAEHALLGFEVMWKGSIGHRTRSTSNFVPRPARDGLSLPKAEVRTSKFRR